MTPSQKKVLDRHNRSSLHTVLYFYETVSDNLVIIYKTSLRKERPYVREIIGKRGGKLRYEMFYTDPS